MKMQSNGWKAAVLANFISISPDCLFCGVSVLEDKYCVSPSTIQCAPFLLVKVLAAKPDYLTLIHRGTPMVKRENWVQKSALWPPHTYCGICLCAYTQTHKPFQNVFLTMCQIKSISNSPVFQSFVSVRQGVYHSTLTPALKLICYLPTHTPVRLTCRLRKSLMNTRRGLLVVAFFSF